MFNNFNACYVICNLKMVILIWLFCCKLRIISVKYLPKHVENLGLYLKQNAYKLSCIETERMNSTWFLIDQKFEKKRTLCERIFKDSA